MLTLDERSSKMVLSKNKFIVYNSGQMTDWMWTNNIHTPTDNTTYSKFIGKLRAQNASLGVTLGEQQSARRMILDRTKQLFDFSRALVRRDLDRAWRIAMKDWRQVGPQKRPNKPPTFRDPLVTTSNLYLEWSWGWRPMVEDIGNALETFVDPITPIYVRASHLYEAVHNAFYSNTTGFEAANPPYYWRKEQIAKWFMKYRCSTGAKVSVDNPNVALANRLGIVNIPQIVYQVTPFSFVLDKYLNIGQMIGSLTDTFGFTLSDAWTARRFEITHNETSTEWRAPPAGATYVHEVYTVTGKSYVKSRVSGLLGPSLTLRAPSIGSMSEAASYMALLYQLLRKET
nr:MAG: maturation protein [Hangzhou fiers-like virus 3]